MSASFFVIVLAAAPAAPALPESVRPLLGPWVCTARTYNGEDCGPDPCVWDFEAGGKLRRRLDGSDPIDRRYAAAPGKAPAWLDWADGEDKTEAIYKIDGDTLTICYSHDRAGGRPARFESRTGTRLVLLVFKRHRPRD